MPARTLATVRGDIRTELNRGPGAVPDARIDQAIQNAIQLAKTRRYGFNVKRAGIDLGAEYVTLPDDFLEIDTLKLDASSYVKPLIEVSPDFIHQEKRSPTYDSEPVYFALERNAGVRQLRLYPQPDETYSAEMVYLFDLAESASFTNNLALDWFDDGYLVVKYAALAEIESVFVGGEEGVARGQVYSILSQNAEKELRRQARIEQHSNAFEPVM